MVQKWFISCSMQLSWQPLGLHCSSFVFQWTTAQVQYSNQRRWGQHSTLIKLSGIIVFNSALPSYPGLKPYSACKHWKSGNGIWERVYSTTLYYCYQRLFWHVITLCSFIHLCRILSLSNLYCFNAWLLLSPSSLCCDWTLGSIPLVTSFSDTKNIWSLVLYTSLAILVLHAICSKRDRLPVGMGLSLLLLPYFPASGALFRVGFVIAERYAVS